MKVYFLELNANIHPLNLQVWDITNSAADTIFDFQLIYNGP